MKSSGTNCRLSARVGRQAADHHSNQSQFTHWSRLTPFALEAADQFRPGGPPKLTRDRYADAFEQVKSLGIAGSTTATADEALTGRFWNGAIQNYWNEIAQTASVAHNLTTAQNARLFALLNLSFADGVIASTIHFVAWMLSRRQHEVG